MSNATDENGVVDATPADLPMAAADSLTADASGKLDAVFELLSAVPRRHALYHLHESGDDVVELDTLAEAVASRYDESRDAKSVAIRLHHSHLPKLESHGVVEYDPEGRTVQYRGHSWVDEWLEYVRSEDSATTP